MKKHLILIAVIGLFLIMFSFAASAETVANGTCGDNVTWTLDDEGLVTISGTGKMNHTDNVFYRIEMRLKKNEE